jgi:hypothetical protein
MPAPDIDRFVMSAWQRVDEAHAPEAGQPAYRIVFKTLRYVVADFVIHFPNLVIRFGHGNVERGGVHLGPAISGRQRAEWYLPEKGRLVGEREKRYEPDPPLNYEFHGWEETVEDVFYVEMILVCDASERASRLADGRRNLASLKTLLDLRFGPRLLGLVLTEEIGELHPDGYWTRSIGSDSLANEWSFDVLGADVDVLRKFNDKLLAGQMARPEAERLKLRLACDWYWSAIHAGDPVAEYLHLWFVVEALAMPNTTNIAPAKARLASALGGAPSDWALVGHHFGRRGRLVHGQDERAVDADALAELRDLVEVLLCLDFGIVDEERFNRLRNVAGVG